MFIGGRKNRTIPPKKTKTIINEKNAYKNNTATIKKNEQKPVNKSL